VNSATVKVKKGVDEVPVMSRELEVKIKLSNGQTATRYLSMLYDPVNGLFWWNTDSPEATAARRKLGMPVFLPRDSIICLTDSRFVLFWNGWVSTGHILIRESDERYPSLNEGLTHVLVALEGRRGDVEAGKFLHEYKEVQFQGLDRDFLFAKNVANLIGPTLKEVRRVGNAWQITEAGPNG